MIRRQRTRLIPSRLDCELLPYNAVNEEGELIYIALLDGVEPLN